MFKKHFRRTGFTLVELLVSLTIVAVMAALVSLMSIFFFQSYSFSIEKNQSVGQVQYILTSMIREIREIRTGEDGAYALVDASDNSFTFFSDVTNDGRTDKVRYFIQGVQLKKGVIEPTTVPVTYPSTQEKISILTDKLNMGGKKMFTYYNDNWPKDQINNPLGLTNRLVNTRFVSVYINIDITANSGATPYELTAGVQIRSLKDNL